MELTVEDIINAGGQWLLGEKDRAAIEQALTLHRMRTTGAIAREAAKIAYAEKTAKQIATYATSGDYDTARHLLDAMERRTKEQAND